MIQEFKKPIDKDDLITVLINGILAGLLGGILAGLADYLLNLINVPISIGLIVIVYFVIWRVKLSFDNYHIIYSCLSILFIIVGLFFSYYAYLSTYYVLMLKNYKIYTLFVNKAFWLGFIKQPIANIILGAKNRSVITIIFGIINLLIYAWAFAFTFIWIRNSRK